METLINSHDESPCCAKSRIIAGSMEANKGHNSRFDFFKLTVFRLFCKVPDVKLKKKKPGTWMCPVKARICHLAVLF